MEYPAVFSGCSRSKSMKPQNNNQASGRRINSSTPKRQKAIPKDGLMAYYIKTWRWPTLFRRGRPGSPCLHPFGVNANNALIKNAPSVFVTWTASAVQVSIKVIQSRSTQNKKGHPMGSPFHLNKTRRWPTFTWGSPTLSLAQKGFTSEFEMGSGGTLTLLSPGEQVCCCVGFLSANKTTNLGSRSGLWTLRVSPMRTHQSFMLHWYLVAMPSSV